MRTPPKRTPARHAAGLVVALLATLLLLGACGREEVDVVTRTGNRELGGTADTGQVNKALTWIPVADPESGSPD